MATRNQSLMTCRVYNRYLDSFVHGIFSPKSQVEKSRVEGFAGSKGEPGKRENFFNTREEVGLEHLIY